METAIGIDLGTSYSCVGVWNEDRVEIISNDEGSKRIASCVSFTATGRLIGDAARMEIARNPTNTIFDAKSLIGRAFGDPVVSGQKLWPFKVEENEDGRPIISVNYKGEDTKLMAEQISAMVLSQMKKTAEKFLGRSVTKAVISVPAFFTDSQRQATKDAGVISGLEVIGIINEPTAAAIAYCLEKKGSFDKKKKVMIFDFGGRKLDVSIVTIKEGSVEVVATSGDTNLGGEDIDNNLATHFAKEFKRISNRDIQGDFKAWGKLKEECEKAKITLSSSDCATVEIASLVNGRDFCSSVTRKKFNDLNSDIFSRCIIEVNNCVIGAKMNKKKVDEIVLMGGSSRIPEIQRRLRGHFLGKDLCNSLNVDEAVAYGAAVRAAILTRPDIDVLRGLFITDVTPIALHLRGPKGYVVVVPPNNMIPSQKEALYVTLESNQTECHIPVYEGKRRLPLGDITLSGIPIGPKGRSLLLVLNIDADGIVSVSASDWQTSNVIAASFDKECLSEEAIQKMVREAEKYDIEAG